MSSLPLIGIVETGAGNIRSLEAAITRLGRQSIRLKSPDIGAVQQLIIPGQGRFGPVMTQLNASGWSPVLKAWINADKPLLGICVGLQILFNSSEENSEATGLNVFSQTVKKLNSPKQPMMGWADIQWRNEQAIDQVYFVNSFVAPVIEQSVASCEYGQSFSAVIAQGRLVACQFHPEKSGATGMRLLQKWLC